MKDIALRDYEASILGDIHNLSSYSPELRNPQDPGFACKDRLPTPILLCDSFNKSNEKRKSKLSRNNKVTDTKISQ